MFGVFRAQGTCLVAENIVLSPLEVGPLNPARASGEHCKLPQLGLGPSPSRNRFWCILAFKSDIWWQYFNDLPENQLRKFTPSSAN